MFEIYVRRMNDAEWEFFGRFNSEREFQAEIPHIRAQGLATKRVPVVQKKLARAP